SCLVGARPMRTLGRGGRVATNIPEGCTFDEIGGFKQVDMSNPDCIHENPGKPCRDVRCDDYPFRVKTVTLRESTLFLDMDGVLADFDKAAQFVLSTDNIYKFEFIYGSKAFWQRIDGYPNFWRDIELMPGAARLYTAVRHLNPVILTALPKINGDYVDAH